MKILTNKICWNEIKVLSLYPKLNNMKKNVSSEKFDVKELVQRIKDRLVDAIEEYDLDLTTTLIIRLKNICKSEVDETLEDYLKEIEPEKIFQNKFGGIK